MSNGRFEIMAEAFEGFYQTDDVRPSRKMYKLYRLWLDSSPRQRGLIDRVFIELCGYSLQTIIEEGHKKGDIFQDII